MNDDGSVLPVYRPPFLLLFPSPHPIGTAGYYGDATMNAVIAIWPVLGMSTPQARGNAYEIGHGMVWAEGEGKTRDAKRRKEEGVGEERER